MTRPPRFPVGSAVRVRAAARALSWRRRLLAGSVGAVVAADAFRVVVYFPAGRAREAFSPYQLELITGEQ